MPRIGHSTGTRSWYSWYCEAEACARACRDEGDRNASCSWFSRKPFISCVYATRSILHFTSVLSYFTISYLSVPTYPQLQRIWGDSITTYFLSITNSNLGVDWSYDDAYKPTEMIMHDATLVACFRYPESIFKFLSWLVRLVLLREVVTTGV